MSSVFCFVFHNSIVLPWRIDEMGKTAQEQQEEENKQCEWFVLLLFFFLSCFFAMHKTCNKKLQHNLTRSRCIISFLLEKVGLGVCWRRDVERESVRPSQALHPDCCAFVHAV